MNFYRAQDEARKQSKVLIALFAVAVIALVLLTNVLFIVFAWFSDFGNFATLSRTELQRLPFLESIFFLLQAFGWEKVGMITLILCVGIGVATWSKWSTLSKGGHVIAESLGGHRVSSSTKSIPERRLRNVVEEMALAAQIPVPQVYVMPNEQGVNAFAAGLTIDDAVVAVSQGAIEQLNREQLQGVVAHEFSHIFNGDMRLNVRIVATLHGLLMINETGRWLIHMGAHSGRRRAISSNRKGNNNGGLFLIVLGASLWLLGTIGQFFGAVIKAALSRQREYLADASAVQFTRNTDGISGALRVIGGYAPRSKIDDPHAHELGHIFFSEAYRSFLFATHPPLDERISRLLPGWDGSYLDSDASVGWENDALSGFAGGDASSHAPIDYEAPATKVPSTDTSTTSSEATPIAQSVPSAQVDESILFGAASKYLVDASSAQLLFFAFVILHNELNGVPRDDSASVSVVEKTWQDRLEPLPITRQLDLLRLAVPFIKELSKGDYMAFRKEFRELVSSDGKQSLSDWVAFELFRNTCDIQFGLAKPPKEKYKTMQSVAGFYQVVASKFVHMATADSQRQQAMDALVQASGFPAFDLLPAERLSSKNFSLACQELKRAYPLLKPRLIKGLLAAAKSDNNVCDTELQLIAVLAAVWDLPLIALNLSD